MDDEPDRAKETVLAGRSGRPARNAAEIYEPKRIARARVAYEATAERIKFATPPAGPLDAGQPAAGQASRPAAAKPAVPADAATPPRPAAAAARIDRPKSPGKSALPSSRQQSHAIAKTVVGSFVERIKLEAQRKGGSLSLQDIEALDHEFEQKTAALEALFERTFQEYARQAITGRREERRHTPFDRLIVTPIELLFPGRGKLTPVKGGLSRRILPGFFMAVSIMMGADVMEQCRDRANIIFDRVNAGAGAGDGPDWKTFSGDSEARVLLTDALVAMAVHFANPDKRAAWMMDLVNNHLGSPESEPDTPADWRLGRPAYERMIDALFAKIRSAVGNAKAREGFSGRYGPETCASLVTIMRGLGA